MAGIRQGFCGRVVCLRNIWKPIYTREREAAEGCACGTRAGASIRRQMQHSPHSAAAATEQWRTSLARPHAYTQQTRDTSALSNPFTCCLSPGCAGGERPSHPDPPAARARPAATTQRSSNCQALPTQLSGEETWFWPRENADLNSSNGTYGRRDRCVQKG